MRILRLLMALFRPPVAEAEVQTEGGSLENKINELQLLLRDAFNQAEIQSKDLERAKEEARKEKSKYSALHDFL